MQSWSPETRRIYEKLSSLEPGGIFATGIENSDPWIDQSRRDQLKEAFDFYGNFELRLENIARLGIKYVRFGIGYSFAHPAKDTYNFDFTDKVISKCQELGLTVLADLLHFGLPEWLHQDSPNQPFFQNSQFPHYFAEYAYEFAKRYPHITYYTPVNEPMLTARFSAKDGFWNEKIVTDWYDHLPFVRAAANIAKAGILAREAIQRVWAEEKRPDEPIFFQNESFEMAIATYESKRQEEAAAFNLHRFIALDLLFGHQDERMRQYVTEQGLSEEEYEWFMARGSKNQTVLGIDYYPTAIFYLSSNGTLPHDPLLAEAVYVLATDYWKRYQMPMMHMEINAWPENAVKVCEQTFESLNLLRKSGCPILGMTWFGDDLQVGWHSLLLGDKGYEETPVGLFYKGEARPVSKIFSELAKKGLDPIKTPAVKPGK